MFRRPLRPAGSQPHGRICDGQHSPSLVEPTNGNGDCVTLVRHHVPEQYREQYLVRGYRRPYSSFADCVLSAFRVNNETLNIWTHLLPLAYLLLYFRRTFPCQVWPISQMDPRYYPLLAEEVSALAYLLGSVIAHTFNCMTPRIRHTCFYIDYVSISMFGIGGACSTYYYLRPLNTHFFLFTMPNVYIGLSSLSNVLAVYLCCLSRHTWQENKYMVRTLAFSLPFFLGNLPSFYRILQCILLNKECSSGLMYIVFGSMAYFLAAILNSTRIPEKYVSQTFDICGHSHQWLHIVTTVGTSLHFWAVHLELEERELEMDMLLEGITFLSSLGWTLGTLFVTATLALWFGSQLTASGELSERRQSSQVAGH